MKFMAKNTNYIDGKKLHIELVKLSNSFKADVSRVMKEKKISKKEAEKLSKGIISEELGEMFLKIAYNLANKNNFAGYTYKEEMIGLGIEYLCRFSKKFDETNPKANAFSYCTQICANGFIQVLKKEQKKSDLKDILIKEAMNKSELEKWQYEEKRYLHEDNDSW
jgi:hypothetical protein